MERAAPAERKHGPAYLEPGGLYMLRRRLSCHMNIDPLKNYAGAVSETKRRFFDLFELLIG